MVSVASKYWEVLIANSTNVSGKKSDSAYEMSLINTTLLDDSQNATITLPASVANISVN